MKQKLLTLSVTVAAGILVGCNTMKQFNHVVDKVVDTSVEIAKVAPKLGEDVKNLYASGAAMTKNVKNVMTGNAITNAPAE